MQQRLTLPTPNASAGGGLDGLVSVQRVEEGRGISIHSLTHDQPMRALLVHFQSLAAVALEVVGFVDLLELDCGAAAVERDLQLMDADHNGFFGHDADTSVTFPFGA